MAKYDDWDADYDYKPRKKEPEIVYVNKPIYKNVWFWVSMSLILVVTVMLIVFLPAYIKMKKVEQAFKELQAQTDTWNAAVDELNKQIDNFNNHQSQSVEENYQEEAPAQEEPIQEEPQPVPTFDGSIYSDMGEGTFVIKNASGNSGNGDQIIIYVNPDAWSESMGISVRDIDGSHISYIYVDGILNIKDQMANTDTSIYLHDVDLTEGIHKIELVQYDNNSEDGNVITYKVAEYTAFPT